MKASCQCGQLSVSVPGPTTAVVACHCSYCQRRSGSPFGVLAYYPKEALEIVGEAARYERAGASGSTVETYFCPACGSTVRLPVPCGSRASTYGWAYLSRRNTSRRVELKTYPPGSGAAPSGST